MCAYQGKASSEAKIRVSNYVASYLGWDHLQYDTWHTERKFNIWYFYDKTRGPRDIETQNVSLKYPLPKRNRRRPLSRHGWSPRPIIESKLPTWRLSFKEPPLHSQNLYCRKIYILEIG